MSTTNSLDRMEIAFQSVDEIAKTALLLDGAQLDRSERDTSVDAFGAIVPLDVNDGESSFYLGIRAGVPTCKTLACALMGMDDLDDIADEDVQDALGEVANLVAGNFKARVDRFDIDARLGTPVVVHGDVIALSGQAINVTQCLIHGHRVEILIIETALK